MSKELKLVVYDFVSVNHYLAYRVIFDRKKNRNMAVSYKTPEATKFHKEFVQYVKEQVIAQDWQTDLDPYQHYYVDAVFYFPRVDMDTNNYWKVAFDAITESGVVWADDNLACERVIKVMYDAKNPRIEYTIHKTDFTGIFNSETELRYFEGKCMSCKRYKRNCSILKKAKEGRVQEEIDDELICGKYKCI